MTKTIAGKKVDFYCNLTSDQQEKKLKEWIEMGCPTQMIIIGYSNGCSSAYGNFHSTIAELENDETVSVWRERGDVRGTLRKYKRQLFERRIEPGAVYLEVDARDIHTTPYSRNMPVPQVYWDAIDECGIDSQKAIAIRRRYGLPFPEIYWVAAEKYGINREAARTGTHGIFYTDNYGCRVFLDWKDLPPALPLHSVPSTVNAAARTSCAAS